MIMVSIALVFAVIVTNLYLRKDSGRRVPACIRRCFLGGVRSRRSSLTNKVTMAENHVNDIKAPCRDREEIELDNMSMLSDTETMTCRGSLRCSGGHRKGFVQSLGSRGKRPHRARVAPPGEMRRQVFLLVVLARQCGRVDFHVCSAASSPEQLKRLGDEVIT